MCTATNGKYSTDVLCFSHRQITYQTDMTAVQLYSCTCKVTAASPNWPWKRQAGNARATLCTADEGDRAQTIQPKEAHLWAPALVARDLAAELEEQREDARGQLTTLVAQARRQLWAFTEFKSALATRETD